MSSLFKQSLGFGLAVRRKWLVAQISEDMSNYCGIPKYSKHPWAPKLWGRKLTLQRRKVMGLKYGLKRTYSHVFRTFPRPHSTKIWIRSQADVCIDCVPEQKSSAVDLNRWDPYSWRLHWRAEDANIIYIIIKLIKHIQTYWDWSLQNISDFTGISIAAVQASLQPGGLRMAPGAFLLGALCWA